MNRICCTPVSTCVSVCKECAWLDQRDLQVHEHTQKSGSGGAEEDTPLALSKGVFCVGWQNFVLLSVEILRAGYKRQTRSRHLVVSLLLFSFLLAFAFVVPSPPFPSYTSSTSYT